MKSIEKYCLLGGAATALCWQLIFTLGPTPEGTSVSGLRGTWGRDGPTVQPGALDSLDAQMGMDKNPFKTYELIMGINIR